MDPQLLLQLALAAPGALLLLLCVLPVVRPPVRSALTPRLFATVKAQLPWVMWAQSYRCRALDVAVQLSALTVSIEWYLLSIPGLAWCGYAAESMSLCNCLAVSTFVTYAMKDTLCSPRPVQACDKQQAQKLLALERGHDVEYGAPSLHTASSLEMNLYLVVLAYQAGALGPSGAAAAVAGCLLWSAWIAWSRMYLGMHSPLDLVMGASKAAACVLLWALLGRAQREWLAASPTAALAAYLAFCAVALLAYPRPLHFTHSYQFAVIFLGASFGGMFGFSGTASVGTAAAQWLGPDGRAAVLAALPAPLLRALRLPLGRAMLGFPLAALLKEVSKTVLLLVLPPLLALAPPALRAAAQPPIAAAGCLATAKGGALLKQDGSAWDVDLLRKFANYAVTLYAVFDLNHCLDAMMMMMPAAAAF